MSMIIEKRKSNSLAQFVLTNVNLHFNYHKKLECIKQSEIEFVNYRMF